MASTQTPIYANAWAGFRNVPPMDACDRIWVYKPRERSGNTFINVEKDYRTARFTHCFLPVISTIPALLGACILLCYSLRLLDAYRPRWTRPFIEETKTSPDELNSSSPQRPLSAPWGLLVVSMLGLTLQIITIFLPQVNLSSIYPSVAWVGNPVPTLYLIHADSSR
jgi:hypothetical protein